jgi:23S rRNA pseudouridine2605 synthase
MTNDGEFSHRMQHPKFKIPKTYRVKIKGNITDKDIAVFKKGCVLDDGYFRPSNVVVEKSNKKSCWIRVTIFQGRNRIIRRFFNSMGKTVVRLIRIRIGGIELSDLRNGHYRYINKREVERLLNMADL